MTSMFKFAVKTLRGSDEEMHEQAKKDAIRNDVILLDPLADRDSVAMPILYSLLGAGTGAAAGPIGALGGAAAGYGASQLRKALSPQEAYKIVDSKTKKAIPAHYDGDYEDAFRRLGFKKMKEYGVVTNPLIPKIFTSLLGAGVGIGGGAMLGKKALDLDDNETAAAMLIGALLGGAGGYGLGSVWADNIPPAKTYSLWRNPNMPH